MLIVTTLVCVVLGTWITRAEQQGYAVRAFFDNGGNSYRHAYWNTPDRKEPWWLASLPTILHKGRAEHYWTSVEEIGLGPQDLPRQLEAAQQFPSVKSIHFDQVIKVIPPETWSAVAKVSTVRELEFFSAPINDRTLGEFSSIPNLRELRIWSCPITSEGIEKLAECRNLEALTIELCPINNHWLTAIGKVKTLRKIRIMSAQIADEDLAGLYDLPNLELVEFEHTRVTPNGAAKLQEKLPRCRVTASSPLPPVQPTASSS